MTTSATIVCKIDAISGAPVRARVRRLHRYFAFGRSPNGAGPGSRVAEHARQHALAAEREGVAGDRVVVAHHAREDARQQQDVADVEDRGGVAEELAGHVEDQVWTVLLGAGDHVVCPDRNRDRPRGDRVHDAHDGDREVRGQLTP